MRACLLTMLCLGAVFISASGCCVHQGAHAINRSWGSSNLYYGPSLNFEMVDHLPYHKERVGYYRWMYNKDPGHQYSKLGIMPPRPECDPDCPCIQDVQGQGGGGIPGSTDSLWLGGVPRPVDPIVFEPPQPPPEGFAPQAPAPATPPGSNSGTRPASTPNVVPPPSLKLPDANPNSPAGPTAQGWGNFKVSGNQPTMPVTTANHAAVVPAPAVKQTASSMPQGEWLLLH